MIGDGQSRLEWGKHESSLTVGPDQDTIAGSKMRCCSTNEGAIDQEARQGASRMMVLAGYSSQAENPDPLVHCLCVPCSVVCEIAGVADLAQHVLRRRSGGAV